MKCLQDNELRHTTLMQLSELGLTQEKVQELFIQRLVNEFMEGLSVDDEGEGHHVPSEFSRKIEAAYLEAIKAKVSKIAEEHVIPKVSMMIENICLTETNKWGEQTGAKMTFTEYLVDRAEKWITEPVNYEGKPKGADSFSWNAYGTRITHMIHQHLQFEIKTAVEKALKDFNSSIAKGIHETVKIQLKETLDKLKVNVTA